MGKKRKKAFLETIRKNLEIEEAIEKVKCSTWDAVHEQIVSHLREGMKNNITTIKWCHESDDFNIKITTRGEPTAP